MNLQHLFDYHVDLRGPTDVGAGPLGRREIFDVAGGTFQGNEMKGTLLSSGGDWTLVGSDGATRLDVRATLRTDDGALVFIQYCGIMVLDDRARATLAAGGSLDYGAIYFMAQPRFETGYPRYAWLNATAAVAEGRLGPGWVEYRVYRLVH